MSKKTWADVKKGDVVELSGREYTVQKIKPKGKKADVSIVSARKVRFFDKVKLSDKVKLVSSKPTKKDPLHDRAGAQQRWATKKESAKALETPDPIAPGDSAQTKPHIETGSDVWDRPIDRVEKKLDKILQARLVGETDDESKGYFVPPVDITTVAAHLALFHGGVPESVADSETAMLAVHTEQHAQALKLAPLAVNHWHTSERPKIDA